MRFETSQSMKLGQSMKLAPRMIQSMEILQMPLAELEERLEQELESNPTLELAEGEAPQLDPSSATRTSEADAPTNAEDFERLEDFEESNPDAVENEFDESRVERSADLDAMSIHRVRESGESDAKLEAMAAAPARSASLLDQLRGQWALVDVEASLRPLGELILNFLEEDGSLKTPLETMVDRAVVVEGAEKLPSTRSSGVPMFSVRPTVEQLERGLKALQLFLEPAGIAARTPAECLLLQLDALEADEAGAGWPAAVFTNARTLVSKYLDDLMQNRLPRVAERTGLNMEQIKDALVLLRRLSLAPGRRLVETNERPIVPDAIVEFDEVTGKYFAYLNDNHLPNLRINMEYALLTKDKAMPKRDKEFIKTNLGNAQWLLDAVNQRRHTLLRVVNKVVEHQREFFDYGPQALRPLPMTQVGEELGIHVATVSRAVAEKFLATPRGVMPLRKFFSGGVQTEGGEEVAWDAIKAALREVIDGEDKKKPLSDDALAEELKKRGIDIARRTVAKYRDQLQIQPARLRKVF
jgi:RNA polymerase sigma-54 factor